MALLYFVRHGQTAGPAPEGDKLTSLGRRQAGVVGRSLAAAGFRPDIVLTGKARPARDTAALCMEQLAMYPEIDALAGLDRVDAGADAILDALDDALSRAAARSAERVLLFAGAESIAVLAATLLKAPDGDAPQLASRIANGALTRLRCERPGQGSKAAHLISFNDFSALEAEPGLLTFE